MNLTNCPLCESGDYKPVFRDRGYDRRSYDVVQCRACHFKFLNPQPSDEELGKIYATYYEPAGDKSETEKHLDFRRPVFEDLCSRLENYKKKDAQILDIGCGNGEFLTLARKHGWNVSGIEISESAAAFAKNKRGLDVKAGSFEKLPYQESTFDAVTILDVLEHIRTPRETLQSIFKILKPGGALVIRVPNTPFQIIKARLQRFRHGKDFTTLATPLHLNHFDSKSLKRFVEAAGFSVEKLGPGAADGEGRQLLLKKTYILLSKILVPVGIQSANIIEMVARKAD